MRHELHLVRPCPETMAAEALPDTLHLYGELWIEPDDIAVVWSVATDAKCFEGPGGSHDFLERLHAEIIFERDRLLTRMIPKPELAHPRLPDKQGPLVVGLVRVVRLDRLAVANLRHDASAGVVVEVETPA